MANNFLDMNFFPKISLSEERQLIAHAQKGFPRSVEELVLRHIGFVRFRLSKRLLPTYRNRFGEDFLSDAIPILYRQIKAYNLEYRQNGNLKPVRFTSYIWKRIVSSILWSPATGLDNLSSVTPIANPTDDITYTMTVTSQNCGISTSSVFVRVYKKVTVPNTFSPNSDGINDLWNIDALTTYPESSIMVFNRYGKKVYQSTGYTKAWDGTYNGSALPEGTYYYVIDLKNNTPKLSGWVFIVR